MWRKIYSLRHIGGSLQFRIGFKLKWKAL